MRVSSSSSVLLATLAISSSTTFAAPVDHPAAFASSSSLRSVVLARGDMRVKAQSGLSKGAGPAPEAHVDWHSRRGLLDPLQPATDGLLGGVDGVVKGISPDLAKALDGIFRGLGLMAPEKPPAHAGAMMDAVEGPQTLAYDENAAAYDDADGEPAVDPALAAQFQEAWDEAQQQMEDEAGERSLVVGRDVHVDGAMPSPAPSVKANVRPPVPSVRRRIARDTPPLFARE